MIAAALAKIISPFFAATTCTHPFFFLPDWWAYLPAADQPTVANGCSVTINTFPNDIWAIGLVALEILLRIAGFAAVISIIVAGVSYITAAGNPEKGASARKRIQNSLIGLAIAIIAASVVAFIGKSLS